MQFTSWNNQQSTSYLEYVNDTCVDIYKWTLIPHHHQKNQQHPITPSIGIKSKYLLPKVTLHKCYPLHYRTGDFMISFCLTVNG